MDDSVRGAMVLAADLVAQLTATSEALRTKRADADLKAASAIGINKQSLHIANGVNVGNVGLDVGAGDQDTTFG